MNGGAKRFLQVAGGTGLFLFVFGSGVLAQSVWDHLGDKEIHQEQLTKDARTDKRIEELVIPRLDLILLKINNLEDKVRELDDRVKKID